jgi:hypothetical protein
MLQPFGHGYMSWFHFIIHMCSFVIIVVRGKLVSLRAAVDYKIILKNTRNRNVINNNYNFFIFIHFYCDSHDKLLH